MMGVAKIIVIYRGNDKISIDSSDDELLIHSCGVGTILYSFY